MANKNIAHFFAAFGYSMAGLRVLMREMAARQELFLLPVVLIVFWISGARFTEYLAVIILFLILLSVEALNTAIENVVDKTSPEKSDYGRDTKDLGSFAVFCILSAIALLTLSVVLRAIGWIAG